MRFCAKDHLRESESLINALASAGHEYSEDGPTDLFLIDLDCDRYGYREVIDFYRECGAVVLQYPHGAPASTLHYDCLYGPYEGVDGQLTTGQGEIDYLRSIGIERPAKIMGWQLCKQFPFRANTSPKRVVFAPTHVNANGGLDVKRCAQNAQVFQALLEGPWELVVRYIGELDRQGLWEDERVFRYVEGQRDMTTVEIDVADCVVSGAGTYPCLAIARGVPTIMYGQFDAAMYGEPDEEPTPLRNLEKYRDLVRYPFDVEDTYGAHDPERPWSAFSLTGLIAWVTAEEHASLVDWRQRWIGEPFDPEAFVQMVEDWVPKLRERRTRDFAQERLGVGDWPRV